MFKVLLGLGLGFGKRANDYGFLGVGKGLGFLCLRFSFGRS